MADEDGLLRLAFDEDDRADFVESLPFLVAFDGDLAAVGYLLLVEQQNLFADNFRDEETHRSVGQFVLGKIGRIFGKEIHDMVENLINIEALGSRTGNHQGARYLLLPVVDFCRDGGLVGEVYLIDD